MSENIQSIANGSFVLGNTNELTFSAGPGISITQPSEGVVRIGNDETVLYSGVSTSTLTLSESPTNFERIKVISRIGGNESNPTVNFGAGSVSEFYTNSNFGAACITGMFAGNSTSGANVVYNYVTTWTGTNTTEWTRTYYGFRSVTATGAYGTNGSWYTPFTIIGVNRISGGNS